MPSLYTEIHIYAPRQRIWEAIVQKHQWKYWNTFLYDCDPEQPFALGQEVLLSLRRLPEDEEIEFQPRITLMQPNACLHWVSVIPGFRNEHVFELQDIGDGRTQYLHRESFSGPLSRLFLPFIRQDEQQGLRRMARELKQYAETEHPQRVRPGLT